MKGFLFLLLMSSVLLCIPAMASAAIVCVDDICTVTVPATVEVVAPPVAVVVHTPSYGVVPRLLRGATIIIGKRTLDVKIDTRRAAVRVRVNR